MRKVDVYSGTEPYIFVSYSHKDSAIVLPIIEQLDKSGFRVWFDEGIEVGSEWPQYIAEHIKNCELVLNFISKNYEESLNCRSEITFALDLEKRFLSVYLIENLDVLSYGLRMQLSINQAIWYNRYNSLESFCNALASAKILGVCKKEQVCFNEKSDSDIENIDEANDSIVDENDNNSVLSYNQAEPELKTAVNSDCNFPSVQTITDITDDKSDLKDVAESDEKSITTAEQKTERRVDSELVKKLKRITCIIAFLYVIIGPVVLNLFVEANDGSENLFMDCLFPMCFPLTIISVINLIIINSQKNKLTYEERSDLLTSEWCAGFFAEIISIFIYTFIFGLKYFDFFISLVFFIGLSLLPFIISFLIFSFSIGQREG